MLNADIPTYLLSLDNSQRDRLKELLKQDVTGTEIVRELGCDYSLVARLASLMPESRCRFICHHTCDLSKPSLIFPFGEGFPNLPHTCPLCDKEVTNYSELSFDFLLLGEANV